MENLLKIRGSIQDLIDHNLYRQAPLRKLLDIEEEELSRPAVAKLMYQYFKDNDMCNEKNKRNHS